MEIPLQSLSLFSFRNFDQLDLVFKDPFVFFYGENAQGKTSILEAIFFLSELRSFRTQEISSLIRHGFPSAKILSTVSYQELAHSLEIKLAGDQKTILWNQKTPKPFRLLRKRLPCLLFTPESVRLFRLTPSDRRHYFDHFFSLISESYYSDLQTYHQLLRQKTSLLEQMHAHLAPSSAVDFLEIWNQRLAEIGSRILIFRRQETMSLNRYFIRHFERLSGKLWPASLRYELYLKSLSEDLGVEDLKNVLLLEMQRRRTEEIERVRALVGPHRDDWTIDLGGFSIREEGSQGQQRLCVAALKLSEVDRLVSDQAIPLLLFDDLFSELDEARVKDVFSGLRELCCQVFLTSVAPPGIPLSLISGDLFRVEQGKVYKV